MTFGAGLKAYLPVGENVVLAAHILPEYVWWRDNDQLSDWHYRYGAGVFGFFNRMTLEVKGHATEQQGYVSAELERLEVSRTRGGDALVDIDISGPFAFFAQGGVDKFEHGLGDTGIAFDERLDVLDRDETFLRGGVKYNLGDNFSIGLGYERTDELRLARRDRSNSGSGPVLVIHKAGSRGNIETNLGYRDIEADNGSEFQSWNALSGTGSFTFKPAGNLIYTIYGARNVVYSLFEGSSYFDDQKVGGSIEAHLGWRSALRGYSRTGENDYKPLPGAVHRIDDFDAWGADLQVKLSDQIVPRPGRDRDELRLESARLRPRRHSHPHPAQLRRRLRALLRAVRARIGGCSCRAVSVRSSWPS